MPSILLEQGWMSQSQPSNKGDKYTIQTEIITQCSEYNIRDSQGIFGNS